MPYDSGAVQVANYGGFGMPTVVLLGGTDHRIMFSSQSFSTADTTEMRDSILALLETPSAITSLPSAVSSFNVFPNPANNNVSIHFDLKETSTLLLEVTDIAGKQIALIAEEKQSGAVTKQFNTAALPNGNYFVRLQVNGKSASQKLTVAH
ncbi:MAG: T9SS type A sorting domain-containing protein [Bacteroidetes bacterium]|nr:T9SS type A sorting domain-containing protein [Bacteroidota bacterium]